MFVFTTYDHFLNRVVLHLALYAAEFSPKSVILVNKYFWFENRQQRWYDIN